MAKQGSASMEEMALIARIATCEDRLEKLEAAQKSLPWDQRGTIGPPPLEAMRANGVTWYEVTKHGVRIELTPGAAPPGPVEVPGKMSMDWAFSRPQPDAAPSLDNDIPDDGPPSAGEPIESPSGFGVDREALREKLDERAQKLGRAAG